MLQLIQMVDLSLLWEIRPEIDGGTDGVPYVWPYFEVIFPYIALKNRPYFLWQVPPIQFTEFTEMAIDIPSGNDSQFALENDPVETVSFPSNSMAIFNSYVSLPEGSKTY